MRADWGTSRRGRTRNSCMRERDDRKKGGYWRSCLVEGTATRSNEPCVLYALCGCCIPGRIQIIWFWLSEGVLASLGVLTLSLEVGATFGLPQFFVYQTCAAHLRMKMVGLLGKPEAHQRSDKDEDVYHQEYKQAGGETAFPCYAKQKRLNTY